LNSRFSPLSLSICIIGGIYFALEIFATLLHVEESLFEETFLGRWGAAFDGYSLLLEGVVFELQPLDLQNLVIVCMVELVIVLLNQQGSTQKM
jgi:hypothetical protein